MEFRLWTLGFMEFVAKQQENEMNRKSKKILKKNRLDFVWFFTCGCKCVCVCVCVCVCMCVCVCVCAYVSVGYSCELMCLCMGLSEVTNAARCFSRMWIRRLSQFFASLFIPVWVYIYIFFSLHFFISVWVYIYICIYIAMVREKLDNTLQFSKNQTRYTFF